MLDVKKLLTKMLNAIKTDYIIEEGSSGDWTWRKWNSGRIEAWAYHNFGSQTGSTWGSTYYTDVTLSLPSSLFTSVKVYASSANPSWGVFGASESGGVITARMIRHSSNAASMGVNFYCEGA